MDIRTLFVTIGLGYGLFAVLLLVSDRPRRGTPTAILAGSYAIACIGVLLQAGRGTLPTILAVVLGNLLAWLALEGQAWAAFAMTGRTPSRRVLVTVVAVTLACVPVLLSLPVDMRTVFANAIYALQFAATAWALLLWREAPRALRNTTLGILVALALMYGFRAAAIAVGLMDYNAMAASGRTLDTGYYVVAFAGLLGSAFGLLMLGKRAAERALADTLLQTETILGTLTTGVAIIASGRFVRVNPALAAMLGYAPDDLEGEPVGVMFSTAREQQEWLWDVDADLAREGRHIGERVLTARTGAARWAWVQAAPLDWRDGERRIVLSVTDISDLKALQDELASRASTDDLTGLLNRRSFIERATVELSRADRTLRPVCIAVIDLDHLKDINDVHGHLAGDRALTAFASACGQALRDVDVVARLGGDEFAIVLPDTTLSQAQAAMERLLDALHGVELDLDGRVVRLNASVGVAEYGTPETLDGVLARADRTMYAAKTAGRGSVARQDGL